MSVEIQAQQLGEVVAGQILTNPEKIYSGAPAAPWGIGEQDVVRAEAIESVIAFAKLGVGWDSIDRILRYTTIARIAGNTSYAHTGRVELAWQLSLAHEYVHRLTGPIDTDTNNPNSRLDGVMKST